MGDFADVDSAYTVLDELLAPNPPPPPETGESQRWKHFWILRIAKAMLEDAAASAVDHKESERGREAWEWIDAANGYGNQAWIFSFTTVCGLLNTDPARTRAALLTLPKGTFASRGGRGRRSRIGGGHEWSEHRGRLSN